MRNNSRIRRFFVLPLIVVLGCVAALYAFAYIALLWPNNQKSFYRELNKNRPVAVVSHQGGEGIRPTNTAIAFSDSWAMGVDVLDADMHMTSDGVLVLAHDETIDRVSDGSGAIRDMTYEQLLQYDFAYDFSTDNGLTYPYRGKGHQIMTLEALYRGYPWALFGIEIKQTIPEAARKLCEITKNYGYENKLLVSAFAQENMDAFREACPNVATSGTESETRSFYILHRLGLAGLYRAPFDSLQVPEYSGDTHILTNRFIWDAQQKGYAVIPWTINEESDILRIADMGVEGINTNFPDRMIRVVDANR